MGKQQVKKVHAEDLHFEHRQWTSQLNLYKEQLASFQKRLEELARRNNQSEVTMKIEQFQNKIILQNNHIDKLLQEFRRDEQHLAKLAQENTTAFDHRLFNDHEDERKKMDTFVAIYTELKNEFYDFVGEWL